MSYIGLGTFSYGAGRNDDSLMAPDYRTINWSPPVYDNGIEMGILWPDRTALFGWQYAQAHYDGRNFEQPYIWTGNHRNMYISGEVLDASSNPVVGATVTLYNTGSGEQVDQTTSTSGGIYTVGDPNNTTNFVVATHAGSQGVTVNTLTGS